MADYSSNANNNNTIVADHPFGKVLARGTPLDYSTVWKKVRRLSIGIVIGILVVAGFLANLALISSDRDYSGAPSEAAQRIAGCVIIAGIVVAFSFVSFPRLYLRRACATEITVYENGIAGTGGGKNFDISLDLHSFQLTWNQVTSADVSGAPLIGGTISIHASGTRYKCFVQNPSEIQGIIVSQQQKRYSA
jgi:hypothetical protein